MSVLVNNKKIRYVGVSNYSAEQMRKMHDYLSDYGITLVSNQVEYNLLNRKIERNGVLETAKELGISIIAYSPLAQGLLSGKFHDNPDLINDRPGYRKRKPQFKKRGLVKSKPLINLLKEIATQYQSTPSQIALNWLIHYHGDIVVAIPGSTIINQARENVETLQFQLETVAMDRLADVSGCL
jgi:aryl-alcohol dehydrogenase-like predicted oxidoreductase